MAKHVLYEGDMVRSREPFDFWWAPTVFMERLNLVKFCIEVP